jgi:hypothetical protein
MPNNLPGGDVQWRFAWGGAPIAAKLLHAGWVSGSGG